MTGKVSTPLDTVKKFPDVCPLCGATILGTVSIASDQERIRAHFIVEHDGRTGIAFRKADAEPFEFCLIGPEFGSSRWQIAVFDWPFEIVAIRPEDYKVHWTQGDPR